MYATKVALRVVAHREAFEFKRPWRWLAEPLLRRWLGADTTEELIRFMEVIELRSPRYGYPEPGALWGSRSPLSQRVVTAFG